MRAGTETRYDDGLQHIERVWRLPDLWIWISVMSLDFDKVAETPLPSVRLTANTGNKMAKFSRVTRHLQSSNAPDPLR